MTESECDDAGFDGACTFKDFGKRLKDEEIPDCATLSFYHTQCNPVVDNWGACYVEGAEEHSQWLCMHDSALEDIERLRRGDCRAQTVPPKNDRTYDGVCRFPKQEQLVYRCDTVPTFRKGDPKTTCNAEHLLFAACFSLKSGVTWSCQKEQQMNPSCRTTPTGVQGARSYSGACLFRGADGYDRALDYKASVTMPTSSAALSTTAVPSSTTATTTSGVARATGTMATLVGLTLALFRALMP